MRLFITRIERKTVENYCNFAPERTIDDAPKLRSYIGDNERFLSGAGQLICALLEIMRPCGYRWCDFTIDWRGRDNGLPLFISSNFRALCAIESICIAAYVIGPRFMQELGGLSILK